MEAGYHSVVWDANSYASGVYFVKMVTGEFVNTQKLMMIKRIAQLMLSINCSYERW